MSVKTLKCERCKSEVLSIIMADRMREVVCGACGSITRTFYECERSEPSYELNARVSIYLPKGATVETKQVGQLSHTVIDCRAPEDRKP